MNVYKPNIAFYMTKEIEERIALNESGNIVFVNHGTRLWRKNTTLASLSSGDKDTLLASFDGGIIYEIAIEACSDYDADVFVDIFNSCLSIFNSAYDLADLIENMHYNQGTSTSHSLTYSIDGSDVPYLACKMIKTAMSSNRISTAVLKYRVSQEVFCLDPMELEPINDTYDYHYLLSRQIKMGYSIIVSYSILEELHLQVKASKEKPSSIDGRWNPEVVSDLKHRLSLKGLDPHKKIRWLSRSTQQRPFKKEIANCELCEWSDGQEVRDFEISIFEAILETSYIRSQIASHSNVEKVTQLCLYDVDNANMLVRSILLDLLIH